MNESNFKTLRAVLKRNNLALEVSNDQLFFKNTKVKRSAVNLYFYFSIIVSVFGIIVFLFFSGLFGAIMMGSAIPMYIQVSKFKSRANAMRAREVAISDNQIKVTNSKKEIKVSKDQIEEIYYKLDENSEISSAGLYIKFDGGKKCQVLEIFSDDRRFVYDDIKVIQEEFSKILLQQIAK